jgi:peptide/nickel transport system ATP-binding protein
VELRPTAELFDAPGENHTRELLAAIAGRRRGAPSLEVGI